MKRFLLEFIGGCWDGMNLCTDSLDTIELKMAEMCLAGTWDGTVGKTVVVPSEYATQRGSEAGNKYVVPHRTDCGEEALVRLELCCDDPRAVCPCHTKRIIMTFEGGHLHGLRLDSGSPDLNEALLATSCFCLAHQGNPGSTMGRFPILPHLFRDRDASPCSGDDYRIVEREEEEDQISLRVRYCPEASGQSEPS